ncbi:hypothetical protein LCGC14_1788220 [marine sediment metagenome]|uniref:Uncharacterized protein n=1 Tax=marine sediment metagenome TaxID=412755 RepID=A0A0F9JSY3_9ZZZZ
MSAATDRAIERVVAGAIAGGYKRGEHRLTEELKKVVLAGWREREGPPPYD